jgi:hypothetical protein
MANVREKLMMLALERGNLDTIDGGPVRMTPKGFAIANVITARVTIEDTPIEELDIQKVINYLKDAEATIELLQDTEN